MSKATPTRALLQLNIRDLVLCGVIENRGAVVIATAFGVVWETGLFDRAIEMVVGDRVPGRGLARDLVRSVIGTATVSPDRVAIALAAFAGLLVFVRVLSMGWAVVRLYGFRVTLDADDLRSEYGLLTRVAATIPLHRIQALTIRETPLHRWFDRVAVQATTAGGHVAGGARSERELLAPLLRSAALRDFVQHVLGGIDLDAVTWQAVAPGAFRREIKGWLFTAALVLIVAAVVARWWALWLLPLLIVWAVIGARQTIKHLGWAVTDAAIMVRRGWLWRRVSVVRFAKIQVVRLDESPFDRGAAMARLRVDTAGATEASRISVPYLPAPTARELHEALANQAARTAFQW